MNVFLLALMGPTTLETNPLSLGFIDVVPFLSFSFFFFFFFSFSYYPTQYTLSTYFLFIALIWLV